MKKETHETIYDFSNACLSCREPVVSYWQGNGVGYSIGRINHKDECEKTKNDKQNLTISTMEKVAKVLGVSVDQLLK